MFNTNDNVYVLTQNNDEQKVYRLRLDSNAKVSILETFNAGLNGNANEAILNCSNHVNTNGIELVEYSPMEKLEENELFIINNLQTNIDFVEIIKTSDTVEDFFPINNSGLNREGYKIKALFICKNVEDKIIVSLQKFSNAQIMTRKRAIALNGNTFTDYTSFAIIINEESDCLLIDSKFIFKNYSNANKIFNLTDYYRVATDGEIQTFKNNNLFNIEDMEVFDNNCAGTFNRKLIAEIIDSNFLQNYTATQIKEMARNTCSIEFDLDQDNNKIVFPEDKKMFKEVLMFLSERMYKGVFTGDTYTANSTRKIEIN